MTPTPSASLGDLAINLGELRRQFRAAARLEVGRAVGEALRDFAQTLICGPLRSPRPHSDRTGWDDPWQDSAADWSDDPIGVRTKPSSTERVSPARLQSALMAGLAAGRWSFRSLGQPYAAVALGLLVALTALLGGPAVEALLEAWASADDLLRDRPTLG